MPPGSRMACISPNERIFNQQQADVDPEIRTIITKTRAALKDVKEHFRDTEKDRFEKEIKFFENFMKDDMQEVDA